MEFVVVDGVAERERLLPLLLDADPDEGMIDRYLGRGITTVAVEEGASVGVLVLLPLGEGAWEVKNLAVAPARQRQGVGAALLKAALSPLPRGSRVWVGTSDSGVAYYRRQGFVFSHTVRGFFTQNYPQPIYENGRLVADMQYLYRDL